MTRTPLLLVATLLLASCANEQRRVFIVTHCTRVQKTDSEKGLAVTLSEPGLYLQKQEVEVEGKELLITQDKYNARFALPEGGQYIVNYDSDTLLSNPAQYVVEMFPGAGNFDIPELDVDNWKPSGNAKADSIIARAAQARQKAALRKEEDLKRRGRSSAQIIYPNQMARISGNATAVIALFGEAPRRIEDARPEEVEYYEVNVLKYWRERIEEELEKENERRSPRFPRPL